MKIKYQQGERFVSFFFENSVKLGIKKAIEKREIPGAQTIFIESKDAKADYERMKEMKAPLSSELETHDWGKMFSINDPDGNKIEFFERPK